MKSQSESDPLSRKPFCVIEAGTGLSRRDFEELWRSRELIHFLVWRDILIRYKQTVMGALWEIVKPASVMIIYWICLGYFLKIPSDGVPYPIFYYSGILTWTFFSQAMTTAAMSVIGSPHLINKIYFPRIVLPIAAVISNLIDLMIASTLLLAMMAYYRIYPTINVVFVPFFVALAMLNAWGVGMFFSAVTVRYRDFQNVLQVVVTLWMFLCPVFYPVTMIPEDSQFIYGLNPMVAVVEGFRWAVIGGKELAWLPVVTGTLLSVLICAGGFIYFQKKSKSFSDWL